MRSVTTLKMLMLSGLFASSSALGAAKNDKKDVEEKASKKVLENDSEDKFKDSEDVKKYKEWKENHERKAKHERDAKLKQAMKEAAAFDKAHAGEKFSIEVVLNAKTFSEESHTVRTATGSNLYHRGVVIRNTNTPILLQGEGNDVRENLTYKNYHVRLYTAMKSSSGQSMLDHCLDVVKQSMASPSGTVILRGSGLSRNTVVVTHQELVRSLGWEWFLFRFAGIGDRPGVPLRKIGDTVEDMFKVRSSMTISLDAGTVSCDSK